MRALAGTKALIPLTTIGAALVLFPLALAVSAREDVEERIAERVGERIAGHYIVVFRDDIEDEENVFDRIAAHVPGFERTETYRHALRGFAAELTKGEVAAIALDPAVAFISEDREVFITSHRTTVAAVQTLPTGINRIDAENLSNKGAGVHVAILDTGIDTTHPDLKANIAGGKACNGSNYRDGNGHGTHVAGTIAAINNSQGVVGVAPAAKIWGVKVLSNSGSGSWSSIICGLDFVVSKAPQNGGPIKVVNMSLGGSGASDNSCGNSNNDALHRAICRTRDAGVTIVVAAGNSGADSKNFVPAAYDDAVITVSALADSNGAEGGGGATTSYGADDTFATFSNFGAVVDIGAPGVSIYSTWKGGSYATMSGTSMASPHVAGAAALYLANNPSATWGAVRDALKAVGEALGAGHADPSGKHPEVVLQTDTL